MSTAVTLTIVLDFVPVSNEKISDIYRHLS